MFSGSNMTTAAPMPSLTRPASQPFPIGTKVPHWAGPDNWVVRACPLRARSEVARPACLVFSPGDICPDNNLLTPGGVRLIDFEASGYHAVFLDAAYLRMPFSTCWCVFRLPPELRDAAEARYRAQATRIWPELADDGTWEQGVRRAVAAWSLNSMWWLLGWALTSDASLEPGAVATPRTRQLMQHRWQVLEGELEAGGSFPLFPRWYARCWPRPLTGTPTSCRSTQPCDSQPAPARP